MTTLEAMYADRAYVADIDATLIPYDGAHGYPPGEEPDAPALPPHIGSTDTCPGCDARCERPESHNWGCRCAPHGPRAARMVAHVLAASGEHSHLSAYGETVCLTRQCEPGPDLLRGTR